MIANYHTHTRRCNHAAEDNERAYVESAIRAGLDTLGFADHSPYPFPADYRSGIRMTLEETADYVNTLTSLRAEYADKIDIRIGFEAEYYPDYWQSLLEFLEPYPYDYLILGQHFLGSEIEQPYMGAPTEDRAILDAYVDQCTRALHTGAYSCLAHPDLVHYVGDERILREASRRLCREALECGVPLELNLLGLGTNRHYPRPAFWEEAAVVGNPVILGWDAHWPTWMEQPELAARAEGMLAELGLRQIDHLELIRPHP